MLFVLQVFDLFAESRELPTTYVGQALAHLLEVLLLVLLLRLDEGQLLGRGKA